MASNTLAGRLILIAEDVAVIAMEIESTFKDAGARSRICSTVEDALVVAEDRDLAAAVVNHILRDGESSSLCEAQRARHSFRALQRVRECQRGFVAPACGWVSLRPVRFC